MEAVQTIKKQKTEIYIDYTLLFIVIFLMAFGLIMLYSTSSYEAMLDYNDAKYYLKRQLLFNGVGLAVMAAAAVVPYTFYKKFGVIIYVLATISVLLIIPMGKKVNGAKRWIEITNGINIQPAEIAKVAIIIFLAAYISTLGRKVTTAEGFWKVMGAAIFEGLLVYKITDNLSSALIIIGIGFAMIFIATPGYKKYILFMLFGIAIVVVFIAYISNLEVGSTGNFRFDRILAWLDPEAYASGKGFQTLQALYAIGSGGFFGKGLGQSMQKMGFIPEAQNDMIFSIICEELGIFGAIGVMAMFLLLLYRMMLIANNAKDLYGSLLVVGVMAHIAIQVVLNIAVVTNTLPNTGITLPFISYGGSAVLFQLIEIGIVLSVDIRSEH